MVHILRYPTKGPPPLTAHEGQMGPPKRRTAGGWIADLAALGKAIVLCETCIRKWQPEKSGYERRKAVPGYDHVMGDCDGCGNPYALGFLLVPVERGTYGGPRV